jgi:hypothetical protein
MKSLNWQAKAWFEKAWFENDLKSLQQAEDSAGH